MRNKLLFLLIGILFPAVTFANNSIETANREVGIALGGHALSYHEYSATAHYNPLDSESGRQPAARFRLGIQGRLFGVSNWYAHLDVNYAQGITHYQGYLINIASGAMSPYSSSTHNIIYDGTVRFGKGFAFGRCHTFQLTPEVVYSYYSWHRNAAVGNGGYLEVYTHQGVGVGVLGQVALGRFVIGLQGTAERIVSASMTSALNAGQFKLGDHYYDSEELSVDYRIDGPQHLTFSFVHQHFLYGASPLEFVHGVGFLEPSSETISNSIYVGYAISY